MKTIDINQIIERLRSNPTGNDPNIFIAAYFWDKERLKAAKTCYKFMRLIDDLVDNKKAENPILSCIEKKLLAEKIDNLMGCLQTKKSNDPFIEELINTIYKYKIPVSLFYRFAQSMQFDIENDGFKTMDEFLHYSEGAAVMPAAIFVHFCALKEIDGEFFAPAYDVVEVARPCALFSYIVHIIRDFEKDQLNNLNYFAKDILNKNGLASSDLKKMAENGKVNEAFRQVVKEYYQQAEVFGSQTMLELFKLEKIEEKYLFSLQVIFSLYMQIFERIDLEKGNYTTQEMNPTSNEIQEYLLKTLESLSSIESHV